MFDFTRLDAIIPVVILCMFCWGMGLRVSRRRRVIALKQASRRQEVLKTTRALQA